MPWKVQTPMTARREFVEDYRRGLYSMAELCARYAVSRPTGYKWVERYASEGLGGLADRRRVAAHCPHRTPAPIAAALLDARRRHPTWGPRKLLLYLARRQPRTPWPAASTVGALLRAHGLVTPRRRRRPLGHPGRPTTPMDAPNVVWTADFKGDFAVGDGSRCYPLTIADGYSRYLLACQGLAAANHVLSRPIFERLFEEHGLPARLRSDNGAPFATCALCRLSRLSVWWLRLGIQPELIEPAHPEQNGRHERMHRTLKAETTRPPAGSLAAQQRRFNNFRVEYNAERPHDGLHGATPASCYTASPRPYPERLQPIEYPGHFEVYYVSTNGGIRFRSRWVNLSHVLAEEYVGLEEIDDAVWNVYFGTFLLGRFDERDRHIHGAHNRNRLPRAKPNV